jgi:glycine cleavage system regulatory protein
LGNADRRALDLPIQEDGIMQNPLILTLVGKDRTGLIRSLSQLIADNGGNWLESRMCRLGGEFAGIVRIHMPTDKEKTLTEALHSLRSEGLTASIHPDTTTHQTESTKSASLSLVGQDHPGILYQISAALAHQNINVEELETECSSAPMSGEMIFTAIAKLQIPESCALKELRKELEEIGSELMVEISFTEA